MTFKKISLDNESEIKAVIRDAFAAPPWNDNWDNETVFHEYILDIIGNHNSLALGAYDGDELVGIATGRLKHWFDGIEFCIDDFCIKTNCQGKGVGSKFLSYIKEYANLNGYKNITLWTERGASAYEFYVKNGFVESAERVSFSVESR